MSSDLVEKTLQGDRRAMARLITAIENRSPDVLEMMGRIYEGLRARGGIKASTVGFTGPPGAGKSTLIDQFIRLLRKEGSTVAVVAVDPSSPFSGGALLGDRIRMQDHYLDEGVFIRSLGSRGSHGGLSRATRDVVKIFEAGGADWIIIETVGVGQTELDVMGIAETTLVVLTPESGDTIQTLKAGLLEIADIFVVNKSDREGALAIKGALEAMIDLVPDPGVWKVPVCLVQADQGRGVTELVELVKGHQKVARAGGRRPKGADEIGRQEVRAIVFDEVCRRIEALLEERLDLDRANPYRLAAEISKRILPLP